MGNFSAAQQPSANAATAYAQAAPVQFAEVLNERVKRDIEEKIHLVRPSANPLIAFTGSNAKYATRSTTSRKFEWQRDAAENPWTTTTTTGTGDGPFTVANALPFQISDVLYCPETEEQFLVSAVSYSGNTITFTGGRAYGTAQGTNTQDSAVALVSGYHFVKVGNARGEKAVVPAGRFTELTQPWNWCQLFMETIELTKDAEKASLYGGSLRDNEYAKRMIEFNQALEFQAYFGRRHMDNVAALGQEYVTGGIKWFASTNVFDLGGEAMTEALLISKAEDVFAYGDSDNRLLICSPKFLARVANWGTNALRVAPTDKTFGFAVKEYLTPHGTFTLAKCQNLKNFPMNTNSLSGDGIFIIDPSQVKKVIKEPTTVETNVQNPETVRVRKDLISGCFGWHWGLEEYHSIMYNWS